MKKYILLIGQLIAFSFCLNFLAACSDDNDNIYERDQPVLISSNPAIDDVTHPSNVKYNIVFNKEIVVNDYKKININGVTIKSAVASGSTLKIVGNPLEENKKYKLTIGKEAIAGATGTSNQEDIVIPFTTKTGEELTLVSTAPEESQIIAPSRTTINFFFSQNIVVVDTFAIKVNGVSIKDLSVAGPRLTISGDYLNKHTTNKVIIPAGAISTIYKKLSNESFTLTFTTSDNPVPTGLVTQNASPEAKNVYAFLRDNYGKKIVSGTMANVNFNINEAEWVYKHTGKYPALNCFDLIHINDSWVNYNNIQIVENWWNNKGLVAYMWHWMVKDNSGTGVTYKPGKGSDETTFDVSKINDPSSNEYYQVRNDLNVAAKHLLLTKQKNIPVIWRPLHEAAGAWFWWGASDAEALKALWKLMFETFEAKGLNNLIWVWTAEANDDSWYPGDEYVDIIGRDLYKKSNAEVLAEYAALVKRYPNKIIALSECGSISTLSEQTENGVYWSWFMTWYDYYRTKDTASNVFNQPGHEHASTNFWKDAFENEDVISRDMMPDLK